MKIVLSYRRSDTAGISGRIFDKLRSEFGADSVFIDVDSIPFGVDFRRHIQRELEGCDVLLAIIGPRWLGEGRSQRIKEETDFVRLEIETALQRDIPVVPVLVDGAKMPKPSQLPEALRDLAFRNAAQVDSGRDFHPQVDRVVRSLDRLLEEMARRERIAHEQEARQRGEQERLEQERLAREKTEAERLEQERLAREKAEAERLEQERLAREKAEALEQWRGDYDQERLEQERRAREESGSNFLIYLVVGIVLAIAIVPMLLSR